MPSPSCPSQQPAQPNPEFQRCALILQAHTAPCGCGQPVFESGLDGGWCHLQKWASQKEEVEVSVGETNGSSCTRCCGGAQRQPKGMATWQLVEWICSSGLAWSCEPREWHRIIQESVCREQRTEVLAQAFSWRSASPDYLVPPRGSAVTLLT